MQSKLINGSRIPGVRSYKWSEIKFSRFCDFCAAERFHYLFRCVTRNLSFAMVQLYWTSYLRNAAHASAITLHGSTSTFIYTHNLNVLKEFTSSYTHNYTITTRT